MKYFISILLLFAAFCVKGQSVYIIRADTTKLMKVGGYNELVILNRTKDSLGVMINAGNGRTEFRRAKMLDSTHLIIGLDTLTLTGGGSGIDSTKLQTAANGLTDSSHKVLLGGDVYKNTIIDLSTFNKSLWIKTPTKTTSDTGQTGMLIIGDTNNIPVANAMLGFFRNGNLVVSKKKTNNNENVDLVSFVTGDAAYPNGFHWQNYTDIAGQVQPKFFTASSATGNIKHGFTHINYMKTGTSTTTGNSGWVFQLFDIDSVQAGNPNYHAKRTTLWVIENAQRHVFILDSLGRIKIGDTTDAGSVGALAQLDLMNNGEPYAIYNRDVNSKNKFNGPILLKTPADAAIGDFILMLNTIDSTVKKLGIGSGLAVSGNNLISSGGSGLTSLNGLTGATQTFAHAQSGTTFNISSSGTAHNFNTPVYYDYGINSTFGGTNSTFWGPGVGNGSLTGLSNVAFGNTIMSGVTTGFSNTVMGFNAGKFITKGNGNTFMGWLAGTLCDSCKQEVGIGGGALSGDTAGERNTAIGYAAGDFMSHGKDNVAIGNQSLQVAWGSSQNIAIGSKAMAGLDGDTLCTMIGYQNNVTNQKISKRAIHIGDNISNTFNVHWDSTILIGAGMTAATSGDTLIRSSTAIGNFILLNRNDVAIFGTKKQVIRLGDGGGNTSAMNAFTSVNGDIFYNTDSSLTGSGYCVKITGGWKNLGSLNAGATYFNSNVGSGYRLAFPNTNNIRTLFCTGCTWDSTTNANGLTLTVTGGSAALSALTAATGTNIIDNATFAQEWQWNTLAGASGLKLSTTSTGAASNLQKMLEIQLSGANATASQTSEGLFIFNNHTGTTPVNIAAHFKVGSGTGYPAVFEGGNVGIGTLTPTSTLHITANSPILTVENTASGGFAETIWKTHNGSGQMEFYALPSTYSGTTGGFKAATGYIRATGASGLGVATSSAGGVIRFLTGGETIANERIRIDSIGRVHFDTTAGAARVNIGGSFGDNNPGTSGYMFTVDKGIFTDNTSTSGSTVASISASSFMGGRISSLQTNVTYTDAATFTIDSAVKAGTNVTIVNPWAFRVKKDNSYFGGVVKIQDTLKTPNIIRRLLDTTNTKPVVVDALGNQYKTDWVTPPLSGQYQPVNSTSTNVSSVSFDSSTYTKIGNTVSGKISGLMTATLSSTGTLFDLQAPFTNITWNSGSGCGQGMWQDITTGLSTPCRIYFSSATVLTVAMLSVNLNNGYFVINYQYDAQ